ncbi:hypothetical protein ACWC5I_11920, partial [Kitasatospora sp. NPDC001574]
MMRGRLAELATSVKPGGVWLYIDDDLLDFHITVEPRYRIADLRFVIACAARWGLSLLDQDECEPEILPDGRTRL